MLFSFLAIATELYLLFNNKGTIYIDFEDLDRVFNNIYCEESTT